MVPLYKSEVTLYELCGILHFPDGYIYGYRLDSVFGLGV